MRAGVIHGAEEEEDKEGYVPTSVHWTCPARAWLNQATFRVSAFCMRVRGAVSMAVQSDPSTQRLAFKDSVYGLGWGSTFTVGDVLR